MRLAIAGAGASAVCLLDALARSADRVDVTVFDPAPAPWRGRPYRCDLPAVRVNAPPPEMSVRDGDHGHFERWLDANGGAAEPDPWSGDRFVPRERYGAYLEAAAAEAIAAIEGAGGTVALRRCAATGVLRTSEQVVVRTDDGRLQPFDAFVLCVGVGRPADLYGLDGATGYVPDPYPALTALEPVEGDTAVIGSGLTAVDTVLALAATRSEGRIALVSRSGVLPGVRQRYTPSRLRHFKVDRIRELARRGPLRLEDLTALMAAEIGAGGFDVAGVARELSSLGREEPRARLARHLGMVDDPDLGLRILQQAVPETGPDVWPRLDARDRELVLQEHYRALMSLCCPMPPASAATLLSLMDSGRLEVVGGLADVRPRRGGFTVKAGGRKLQVATVVNAASAPRHRVPPAAAPLVDSLVRSGAARPHPHGGLRIDPATSRAVGRGGPDDRLYVLGDLAAGTLFFTFGIPSLVDRARDIAASLSLQRRPLATPANR
jgi:uncharacterized NAD(P)/FAD-binding protein YdhS